ncbi:MAG TPA: type II toxin-antitoxin system HicB family antitoxin [Isosphaeraceae bacterium]|jgi:predicted HicB family RNase H-like nuclease
MSRNLLSYRSYLGSVRFDVEEGVFRGRVVNIDDVVTFQGKSVEELKVEFRNSIDDYLEQCAELGEEPDRPLSGRLTLRMRPETHRILKTFAQVRGRSLNQQVSAILNRAASKAERSLRRASVSIGDPPPPRER